MNKNVLNAKHQNPPMKQTNWQTHQKINNHTIIVNSSSETEKIHNDFAVLYGSMKSLELYLGICLNLYSVEGLIKFYFS